MNYDKDLMADKKNRPSVNSIAHSGYEWKAAAKIKKSRYTQDFFNRI